MPEKAPHSFQLTYESLVELLPSMGESGIYQPVRSITPKMEHKNLVSLRLQFVDGSKEFIYLSHIFNPGRSYGGACCNAMLKVLYDAANEAGEASEGMNEQQGLFDDDDEDDATLTGMSLNRNNSFASLDRANHSNPSTVTWAEMMTKMKAEIKDIEYAQVPKLTSTRKLSLDQPFSLVPQSFDPRTCKRRSLLVGCDYNHLNGAQLKASHDDVRSMKVSPAAAAQVSSCSIAYLFLMYCARTTSSTSTGFPRLKI